MTSRNITLELAELAVDIRLADIPAPVLTISRQAILDWLGVTLAGADESVTKAVSACMRAEGGHAQCGLIGSSHRLPASAAALVNGTASHALDYDDVSFSIPGHAAAPVIAATLALAEQTDATGARLLEAFVAGYETSCRIGQLVSPNHYARGFHATATIGVFGAAAACARLLGLDAAGTAQAFGIAATRAAGLKAAFGSSCKPLQVGEAARGGLLAARLAHLGVDAPVDMLGHRLGFACTHSDNMAMDAALGAPRYVADFGVATSTDAQSYGYHLETNLFKYHASCYETHSAIECALRIAGSPGFDVAGVCAISINVNPHCNDICNIASPVTPMQAKFSLRHTVAMALLGRATADPAAFTDTSVVRADTMRLQELAEVALDPALRVPQTRVRVTMHDGRVLEHLHDSSVPNTDLADQQNKLIKKFRALAKRRLAADAMAQLEELTARIEALPGIGQWMRLTTSAGLPISATWV